MSGVVWNVVIFLGTKMVILWDLINKNGDIMRIQWGFDGILLESDIFFQYLTIRHGRI